MGKTYRDTDKYAGDMKGRSQGKSGRYDDPDMELDMKLMAKNKSKKSKGSQKQQNGKS